MGIAVTFNPLHVRTAFQPLRRLVRSASCRSWHGDCTSFEIRRSLSILIQFTHRRCTTLSRMPLLGTTNGECLNCRYTINNLGSSACKEIVRGARVDFMPGREATLQAFFNWRHGPFWDLHTMSLRHSPPSSLPSRRRRPEKTTNCQAPLLRWIWTGQRPVHISLSPRCVAYRS